MGVTRTAGSRSRNRYRAAVWAALIVALAACTSDPTPTDAPAADLPSPTPFQRTFGPVFPAVPPTGPRSRIEGVLPSRDRRSILVAFTGGKAYDPRDPCSGDYEAWAGGTAATLELQVSGVIHPEQVKLGPNTGCTMEGYSYRFSVLLPGPFLGAEVRDRESGPLWVPPPERVAELVPVPAGWQQGYLSAYPESRELCRMYMPRADGGVAPVERNLTLCQVFGAAADRPVEVPVGRATIRGQDVPVGRAGDIGYLVSWRLGADGMSLISYDAGLTLEAFIAMANAVAIPGP